MCILNWLKDLEFIIAYISLVLLIATFILVWIIPRRVFKNQVFSDLLNEYRSTSMGIAIKHVWDFYRNNCKGKITKVAYEYNRLKNIDEAINTNEEEWRNSLHYHRRIVSHFYRHLAMFRFGRFPKIRERKIKSFFTKGDLEILKIIILIEESFVKKGDQFPESIIYLTKLYYKSQSKR